MLKNKREVATSHLKQKIKKYLFVHPDSKIKYQIFGSNIGEILEISISQGLLLSVPSRRTIRNLFKNKSKDKLILNPNEYKLIIHQKHGFDELLKDGYKMNQPKL